MSTGAVVLTANRVQKQSAPIKCLAFVASGLLFYASFWVLTNHTITALLTLSVAFHEVGHFLAVKSRKRKSSILFVPLLGGVTHMDSDSIRRAEVAYIAIMGPLATLLLAVIALLMSLVNDSSWLVALAGANCTLGMLNLLPLNKNDGGIIHKALHPSFDEKTLRSLRIEVSVLFSVAVLAVAAMGQVPYMGVFFLALAITTDTTVDERDATEEEVIPLPIARRWARILTVTIASAIVLGGIAGDGWGMLVRNEL